MAKDVLYGLLVLVIGAIVMYGVYLSLPASMEDSGTLPITASENEFLPAPPSTPICVENDELPCTLSNGCPGKRVCFNGEWITCIAPFQICEPGSTQGCGFVDVGGACSSGTRECNECGTEWGECS